MAEHRAHIRWERSGEEGEYLRNRYSRAHEWTFDGGVSIVASSSPFVVPEPMSLAAAVDPEEAFVAALASCHMLFFLSYASQAGYLVDRYEDRPTGTVARAAGGGQGVTHVVLRPRVEYGGASPERSKESQLHEQAHASCYLARSVTSTIAIDLDSHERSSGSEVCSR